jgi:hypothetical protein
MYRKYFISGQEETAAFVDLGGQTAALDLPRLGTSASVTTI